MKKQINAIPKILIGIIIIIMDVITKSQAQIDHPVKWSYTAKKLSATEVVIMLKADIDPSWHIYSINQKEGGPVKTSFTFDSSEDYILVGGMSESAPITQYEKNFSMNVSYFENTVTFQQKVKLRSAHAVVKGMLNFMTCNDQKCLLPEDLDFSIPIK